MKTVEEKLREKSFHPLRVGKPTTAIGINDALSIITEALKLQREDRLVKGCVVMMSASSGLVGYGNSQCVSSVCEPLGEVFLYGHNESYKISDIEKIIEYPYTPQPTFKE